MLRTVLFIRSRVISGIPSDVKNLISRYISSVWQLEILLCLKRQKGQNINCHDIAKELYISEEAIDKQLKTFVQMGVVKEEERGFKYKPGSEEMAATLDVLESLYSKRRVAITDLIYRQSNNSMKSMSDLESPE